MYARKSQNISSRKAVLQDIDDGTSCLTTASLFRLLLTVPTPPHALARCLLPPQARLPHGIAAIRDHIESVDNVPLLVSLFTDATPATTKDMLKIYQENDECTLAVGMSHR